MTASKKDVEDISVQLDNCTLIIKYPEVNYSYWKSLIEYKDDLDIQIILENLLIYLDCTITYSNSRLLYTNQMMYEKYISDYYYYLIHIENHIIYNEFFNMLCERHKDNIQFELDNPIIEKQPITKVKNTKKKESKPVYIRQVTTDMFSGKETYQYINTKTNDVINSEDPNLLDSFNIKKKKVKPTKVIPISMGDMTFSFKKK